MRYTRRSLSRATASGFARDACYVGRAPSVGSALLGAASAGLLAAGVVAGDPLVALPGAGGVAAAVGLHRRALRRRAALLAWFERHPDGVLERRPFTPLRLPREPS